MAVHPAATLPAEHPVDDMGRCSACRYRHNFSLWLRRRAPCAVHDTFTYFCKGRSRFVHIHLSHRDGRNTPNDRNNSRA